MILSKLQNLASISMILPNYETNLLNFGKYMWIVYKTAVKHSVTRCQSQLHISFYKMEIIKECEGLTPIIIWFLAVESPRKILKRRDGQPSADFQSSTLSIHNSPVRLVST